MKTLMIASMMSSMMLVFLKHPMTMGLMLMIQTVSVALMTSQISHSPWYSYVLFLVMIGGMLVLFTYMTSIASNEKFKMSNKLMATTMLTLLLLLTMFIIDPFFVNLMSEFESMNIKMDISTSFSKYLNFPAIMISSLLIIYLLICLIAVVKITNISHGPLRHSN